LSLPDRLIEAFDLTVGRWWDRGSQTTFEGPDGDRLFSRAELGAAMLDAALLAIGPVPAVRVGDPITGQADDEEPAVLQLGVEDEAARPVGLFKVCPICLKANPCDRHSLAVQIRALDDPEYLESLVPPTDLGPRS
jgi:hypothetical protein